MDYFVTNGDLQAIFKNCKIIKYAELDQYSDIYHLLPNRMDFCFILTESELNSGHWTLLIRDDNNFEYFDSYGTSPKNILDYIPTFMNKRLGNNYNEDIGMMIKSIKKTDKFIYNKTKFQKEQEGINTCGRWVIARLSLFLSDDLDLNEFTKLIKTKSKQLKMTNDEFITFLVNVN
jgi:Ulp1 family protease